MKPVDSTGADLVRALAERLMQSSVVAQGTRRSGIDSVRDAAWEVATGLADIQEASARLADLIDRLLTADPPEIEDLLHQVGEEYRHVLYHIMNTKFFNYVVPDA